MKNKRKSITRRIFALVAVAIIVALSVVPCFAVPVEGYTITNSMYVPVNNTIYYKVYTGDSYNPTEELYTFETYLPMGNDVMSIYESGAPNQAFFVYLDDSGKHYVENDIMAWDFPTEPLYYFPEYVFTSGNFFINPQSDEFAFDFTLNNNFEVRISVAYIALSDTYDGEVKTGVIRQDIYMDNGTASYSFDLAEQLRYGFGFEEGLGDVDVFVYAFEIEILVDETSGDTSFDFSYYESDTFIDRNVNLFLTDVYGNVEETTNSMSIFVDYFLNHAIDEYNKSFDRVTADYTSWIGTAVSGFLNMELLPFFSIGGVLLVCVAIGLVGYFLKVFMGG